MQESLHQLGDHASNSAWGCFWGRWDGSWMNSWIELKVHTVIVFEQDIHGGASF